MKWFPVVYGFLIIPLVSIVCGGILGLIVAGALGYKEFVGITIGIGLTATALYSVIAYLYS